MLGMGVHRGRCGERGVQQFPDQRDPAATAHQHDGAQPVRGQPGRADRPFESGDRVAERGSDQVVELAAGQPERGGQSGQRDRQHRVGVGRQRLLRVHAVATQPGEPDHGVRVVRIDRGQAVAEHPDHVLEEGFVEVDAAEVFDALGRAEQAVAGRCLLQQAGVERAAAEVVHGDHVAGVHPGLGGVLRRRRQWFRAAAPAFDTGQPGDLVQQLQLVGPPVRRVGQHHLRRGLAHPVGRGGHDVLQQSGGEGLRRERVAGDQDRHGVADPALELSNESVRLGQSATLRGLADEQRAVVAEEQHRRDLQRPVAEAEHGRLAAVRHRGRGERGAEIDPEPVGHGQPVS